MIQIPIKKEQIVFKVQFASSEKEMDYKWEFTYIHTYIHTHIYT
jgi:hypothetical protein